MRRARVHARINVRARQTLRGIDHAKISCPSSTRTMYVQTLVDTNYEAFS